MQVFLILRRSPDMVWTVSFRRTILWGSLAWIAAISGLHAWLNLEFFRARPTTERALKIGYLPVT